MKRGERICLDYGWGEAERELADGIHPEVVAARLGEPITYLIEVADERGWSITWSGQTPDEIIKAAGKALLQ